MAIRRRRYAIEAITDVPSHEQEAEIWAEIQRAPVSDLLEAIERKGWRKHQFVSPPHYWGLQPALLERLRRRVIDLVHREHGGRYETNWGVVRSDGQRMWSELKGAS